MNGLFFNNQTNHITTTAFKMTGNVTYYGVDSIISLGLLDLCFSNSLYMICKTLYILKCAVEYMFALQNIL